MDPTKEALQDLVKQIAASAKKNVRKNGGLDPVALIFGETLSESKGLVLDLTSEKSTAASYQAMRVTVKEMHAVAVVVVKDGEMIIAENDEEAQAIYDASEHPRRKHFISIQASTPIVNHEIMIEYNAKGKRVTIGEEYNVLPEEACDFTRGLWGVVH